MEEYKTKLWLPVIKDKSTGEYLAALSDDSIDRDDEAMHKDLIYKWSRNVSLKALANHDNKMQSWVGGWNNLQVKESGGNAALFAKPWFFSKEANPLAHQIKMQVDEALANGEHPGISIGAIIKDYKMQKINGKEIRVFTDGELLEATWVPIQSNRNATYGHIAKKFGVSQEQNKNISGGVSVEITQKDIDAAVEKATAESAEKLEELNKQMTEKDAEIVKFKKESEEKEELLKSKEEELSKAKESMSEAEKQIESLKKECDDAKEEAEKEKKKALEKASMTSPEGKNAAYGVSSEDAEKNFKDGRLPIFHMER